jgi:hypothetical protein
VAREDAREPLDLHVVVDAEVAHPVPVAVKLGLVRLGPVHRLQRLLDVDASGERRVHDLALEHHDDVVDRVEPTRVGSAIGYRCGHVDAAGGSHSMRVVGVIVCADQARAER